ncbi:MAG: adenylyltransferase/cytidyltransferase family protein, partial [Bacteroidia bacterium]|nr:adenylyltransferase/cytidyltransferase family protein [Bacteroidia bacterium]
MKNQNTLSGKICTINDLKVKLDSKRAINTIVFTNGCFDILHPGHILYLEEAKALGDILIVGLNEDDSVSRLKGQDRPINAYED